jgi:bacteriorhodopsin
MTQALFWVGVVGMLAGTALFGYWGATRSTDETRAYYAVTTAITGVATLAYAGMALGVGSVTVGVGGDQVTVELLRYADWLVTTPLLLVDLALLAAASRRVTGVLVVLDVVMIALGAAAALVTQGLAGLTVGTTRLALWGASSVVFLLLLGGLLRVLSPQAGRKHRRNPEVAVLFSILRNLTIVVWLLYPVVWLLAPTGLDVLGAFVVTAAYLVLDLAAKVGFGALLLRSHETLESAEA